VLPDGTHLLVNPDEIMPADFTSDMLRDDIDEYMRMHTWMQKKLPKYVRTSGINCEEKGDRSASVCNYQNRTRIKDRVENQDLRDYYRDLKLEGNIYQFWSPRDLRKIEQLDSQLNLLGELPSLMNYIYPY
jgi:hypothetical protein